MDLNSYFSQTKGTGILATANSEGQVDTALYGTPRILQEGTVSFIMRDRLSHKNLQSNPLANYMFIEKDHPTQGVRLFLHKVEESTDKDLIASLAKRSPAKDSEDAIRYLVTFSVEKVLNLVGGEEA